MAKPLPPNVNLRLTRCAIHVDGRPLRVLL
jgi:hypothetical protein